MQAELYNGLCLAYIGDAVYETYARKHVLKLGYNQVNKMHHMVTQWTNAQAQATCIHHWIEENLLSEHEVTIYKRGRNSHVHTARKNVDLKTYLDATGFEALIGYLYLTGEIDRLEMLVEDSFK